jgi:hypothetical protein
MANSTDFQFRFNDTTTHILYDDKEWEYLAKEGSYSLWLAKQTFGKEDVHEIHTMVVFEDDGFPMNNVGVVKRIFTYGMMSCELSQFSLMAEFYSDKEHKILFASTHQLGEYVASLAEKNTARNAVWARVCNTTI